MRVVVRALVGAVLASLVLFLPIASAAGRGSGVASHGSGR